ncbi:MAG: elongation factor P [Deltaproteobacteria bacterium]|nr:elongation factor P [Deltaproteobacteria bacterium]
MYLSANRIRVGNILEIEGDPCKVMDMTHVTPGKGQAVVQTKMRNLRTGVQFEQRFRATEDVKRAFLDEHEMEFLYADGDIYHFMNTETYEQIGVAAEVFGDMAEWLTENMRIKVQFFGEKIVGAQLPQTLELEIVETAPPLKGATATNSPKPAKLENGVTINVPPFIETGEKIRVDPEARAYLERVR